MSGYTKLFSSIVDSSVWQESKETKVVWVTMLALKNRYQVVEASLPGLAARAGVTIEECAAALEVLKRPDPYSRSKEYEGRRIEEVEGGWRLLNGEKYRNLLSAEQRLVYKANWQKGYRQRKRKEKEAAKVAGATAAVVEAVSEANAQAKQAAVEEGRCLECGRIGIHEDWCPRSQSVDSASSSSSSAG